MKIKKAQSGRCTCRQTNPGRANPEWLVAARSCQSRKVFGKEHQSPRCGRAASLGRQILPIGLGHSFQRTSNARKISTVIRRGWGAGLPFRSRPAFWP